MSTNTFTEAELREAEASRPDWIISGLDPNTPVETIATVIRNLRRNAAIHDERKDVSNES